MPRVKRRAFKSSNHLKEEELQIICLRHPPQDRVIRSLLLYLDLPQLRCASFAAARSILTNSSSVAK